MLTVQELIDHYGIYQVSKFDPQVGKNHYENIIGVCDTGISDEVIADIKSRKAEIIDYLTTHREAEAKAERERAAKINAIEGLVEIKKSQYENELWRDKQQYLFEKEDPLENRFENPPHDIKAMRKAYPKADAYLKAESVSMSSNYEKSAIGRKAKEAIIDGKNYEEVIKIMNNELDILTKQWTKLIEVFD